MKRLIGIKGLSHREWLSYRKKGIGGSDAGAVCGVNPYRSAIQVYYDKTTEEVAETEDNEAMRQGRDLEDYVARRFTEETGKKIRRANYVFYDEENPFMLADVDRMVVGERAGLECKTASPYVSSQWEDGKIPVSYLAQVFHYMSVCQADIWYLAVLIYGREFKIHTIHRDEIMIRYLKDVEQDFWYQNVLKRIPPKPDGGIGTDRLLTEQYPGGNTEVLPLVGFDEQLRRREILVEEVEKLEQEKKKIEQELKLYMGNAEVAQNGQYRILWKSFNRDRLDEKRLKVEHPEIYEAYQVPVVSRRFTIKTA